jgi:hypothetical protein
MPISGIMRYLRFGFVMLFVSEIALWVVLDPTEAALIAAVVTVGTLILEGVDRLIVGGRLASYRNALPKTIRKCISGGLGPFVGGLLLTFAFSGETAHQAGRALLVLAAGCAFGTAFEFAAIGIKRGYFRKPPPPELTGGRQYGPLSDSEVAVHG